MLLRPIPTLLLFVIAGCAASGSPDHGNEPNLLEVVRGTGDPPTAARTGGASAESWPIPLAYFEDFEDAKVTLALEGAGAATSRATLPLPWSEDLTEFPAQEDTARGEAPFSYEGWHFSVAPYVWLPTIKAWINDVSRTIHKGDILDNLDFFIMGVVEARYQRWGLMLDAVFFDLEDKSHPTPRIEDKFKLTESLYQLQPYYRFGEEDTFVDVTAGVRWIVITGDFRLQGVTIGRARLDWFEPVVGLRVGHRLAEDWLFRARMDIGGFSVGEAARQTYQGVFELEYELSDTVGLQAGYRYLHTDHSSRFNFRERVAGPLGGVTIRF